MAGLLHKSFLLCAAIIIVSLPLKAQNAYTGSVSGVVRDAKTTLPLSFATVAVIRAKDSTEVTGNNSDDSGKFVIDQIPFGNYYIKITSVGYHIYKSLSFTLKPSQATVNLGTIKIHTSATQLGPVVIEAPIPVQQKGDTTEFNANAFKTHPDATAEDLITKMPGLISDNGTVKVNGEQVQQVLVDGKPFFGNDPNMALKNLPAEVIDKIQVFDKLSDQAEFTGFDDGNSLKTINIITKQGKSNGQFGKFYAGYGYDDNFADDRYIVGGNLNLFNNDTRFSVIGLSNNINQQNFGTQDLLGVVNSGSGGGQGRGYGGRSSGGGNAGGSTGSAFGGGGGGINNFIVGQAAGIATTNSLGLNYSDKWGSKIKLTASYFFNSSNTNNVSTLTRQYVSTKQDSGIHYDEHDQSNAKNYNHRFNLRFQYDIDSSNSIIFTPSLNYQSNNTQSQVIGSNLFNSGGTESTSDNNTTSINSGYTFSDNLLFRHRFKKKRRTISLNISTSINNRSGSGTINSRSNYFNLTDSTVITDQQSTNYTKGYTISPNLAYTEPIGKLSILQFNYNPSYSENKTDRETDNYNPATADFDELDTILSNKYQDTYVTQKGGISYRVNGKKLNLSLSVNGQLATLSGSEIYPNSFEVNKNFNNILPSAILNYKFSKEENIRIMYRTSNTVPSIAQLQDVINNTNPLLLSTGNPNLKQDYEHTLITRFGKTNSGRGTSILLYLYGNYAFNYIGNSTFIANNDTTIDNRVPLNKGSQISMPANMNNYWNTKAFFTFGKLFTKLKFNLNLNTGLTDTHTPALINNATNYSNNYALSQGVVFSSNINESIDFTLSYTGNYNIVNNTLQAQLNDNYFSQNASFKFNYIYKKRVVFNTNITETLYDGLAQNYNQQYFLWNAALGYKFLKNQSLDVRASVFDILNQNNNIARTVTDTYIEDSQTRVLTRYFMLTATYTLRNFKK